MHVYVMYGTVAEDRGGGGQTAGRSGGDEATVGEGTD